MHSRTRGISLTTALSLLCHCIAGAQQVADSAFDTSVRTPANVRKHPVVVIDEAHVNFHTASGRYLTFARLLRSDGYVVREGRVPFSVESLRGVDVLVIANALGQGANVSDDTSPPAFTNAECDAVRAWVRRGGALLLVADHAPFGGAAANLARRFGFDFGLGFVWDTTHALRNGPSPSLLVFTRREGLLGRHVILQGRYRSERINRVIAFTGQSMNVPGGAVPLLNFSPQAREAATREDERALRGKQVTGRAQGMAMRVGSGRLVVLGEAAMLTAQLAGAPDSTGARFLMGMNHPGSDDKQFALNVVRWLSGALK